MTTTITVETHECPAAVTVSTDHYHHSDHTRGHSFSTSTVFVPKNNKQQFTAAKDTTVAVSELPADATGLARIEANF